MTTFSLEQALFDYLSEDPVVSALVGAGEEARIYPFRVPEGKALPAISYARAGTNRTYTYDSFEETNAFVRARVSFHCWSNVPDEAMQVGEAVMLALSGYGGQMGGQLVGASFNVLEIDIYEPESKMYRRTLDFHIMYEEDLTPSSS
jgi:hypothetical protein